MRKVLVVIRREYLQSVARKSFWIGTLIFPAALTAIFGLALAAHWVNPEVQKRIALIDQTGEIAGPFREALSERRLSDNQPEFVLETVPPGASLEETRRGLEARVLEEEIHGILVVREDLDPNQGFSLYLKSVGDEDVPRALRQALQSAVISLRIQRGSIDLNREALDAIIEPVSLRSWEVKAGAEATEKDPRVAQIGMLVFSMLLYITLYFWGFATARGIIAEKSSRVMEVLLGSMSPQQLMTGKILGIALVGLTQMVIYALTAYAARLYIILRMEPERFADVIALVAPARLLFFLAFFLLGYFLYTSMFAVIGAASNTEQDAQNLQFPLIALLMIPYVMSVFFVKHPDSTAAVIASFFPPFTPMVMFMRISVLTPPAWQIALSFLLLMGAIFVVFRAAAKVFRIGTLMHGKRPTLPEILRWARS